MADAGLLSVLPNLSIGVVSVLAFAYYAIKSNDRDERKHKEFIQHLEKTAIRHDDSMRVREQSLRDLETDVRKNLTELLTANTVTLQDVARVMGRIVRFLDGEK